jgi:hypothetical protein
MSDDEAKRPAPPPDEEELKRLAQLAHDTHWNASIKLTSPLEIWKAVVRAILRGDTAD